MNYKTLMNKARSTNARRDKLDKSANFSTPDKGPLSLCIRTAMQAIECGIILEDWNCIAEGQVMLETLVAKLQTREDSIDSGILMADGNLVDPSEMPEIFEQMADVLFADEYLGE